MCFAPTKIPFETFCSCYCWMISVTLFEAFSTLKRTLNHSYLNQQTRIQSKRAQLNRASQMEAKANEAKQIGNVSFFSLHRATYEMASCRLSNLKFASNMLRRMGWAFERETASTLLYTWHECHLKRFGLSSTTTSFWIIMVYTIRTRFLVIIHA